MVRFGGDQVTHVYDLNGNVISTNGLQLNIGNALVSLGYDKENRQITHNLAGTIVIYTYSGDCLKRSEITSDNDGDSPGLLIATLVWDGSEYLGEHS